MSAPKDPIAYALWKERMSASRKGEKNPFYGKHLSEESKKKISEAMTGKMVGEKNPMFGVHLKGYWRGKNIPNETKQKISETKKGMTAWNKGLPSTWTKGVPRTEEVKRKISESNKGKPKTNPAWNKGKPFSEDTKEKMRQAKLGKKMSSEFCQKRSEIMKEKWSEPDFKEDMTQKHAGENNANFGKPISEEQRQKLRDWERTPEYIEKLREASTGKMHTEETKAKISASHSGYKCYNWKGGITPVYRHIRGHRIYKEWCANLLKKHDYTDAFTGHKGGLLSCHHIIPVNMLIKMYNITDIEGALACALIWDLNNGLVILKYAHDKFHNLYGDGKNIYELTPDQIKELYL